MIRPVEAVSIHKIIHHFTQSDNTQDYNNVRMNMKIK